MKEWQKLLRLAATYNQGPGRLRYFVVQESNDAGMLLSSHNLQRFKLELLSTRSQELQSSTAHMLDKT